ncbi:MAG: NAD-dependent epimerase/dehydratase family protein [Verrucomicrobiales bacterium]|nr:NAD-dependent epimerase/dehydratase family protein [Verrucomicrobiales bacterium]
MAVSPTILVTGGTGFIGRHLVSQLLGEGHGVRVFCRSGRKAEALFGNRVDVVEGDVTSVAEARRACRGVDRVFHVAGLYCFGARHRRELWRVNVEGTRTVLDAARAGNVRQVVHCSTAGILSGHGRLITHLDLPARPPAGCGYKISKWHGERLALEAAASGMPVVIASPTAPIGAGDERPTPTGRMILDLMEGRFPACSRTGINVISVGDLTRGLVAVSERGSAGERYVLGHENLWLEEFLARVATQVGRRAPRAWVPWPLVAAGGLLGDLAGLMTGRGGERLCWETAYYARQRQFFDVESTERRLGWRSREDLDGTIRETVEWFCNRAGGRRAETPVDRGATVLP